MALFVIVQHFTNGMGERVASAEAATRSREKAEAAKATMTTQIEQMGLGRGTPTDTYYTFHEILDLDTTP